MTSRRHVLGYLGAAGAGAAVTGAAVWAQPEPLTNAERGLTERGDHRTWSPWGAHQAGIATPTPAATQIVALDLLRGSDAAALKRLLRLWTGDVEALAAGRPVPGDTTRDLAAGGVSMTVTVGFGPGVFALSGLGGLRPAGLSEVPRMRHDKLQPRWCGGDLVLLVAAEDATSVAYAVRALTRDAESFARPRWVQTGSWRGFDSHGAPLTGRNLFGQVDGTGNPSGELLDEVVWSRGDRPWFDGGTTLVIRRIEMQLDTWDELTRDQQESAVGRRLDTGAPLTGQKETDALDLAARSEDGRLVIPADAHARLSHVSTTGSRILRRGLNYTHSETVDGGLVQSTGLIFCSFQADIARQFTPIQTVLDRHDALNTWTTAIGSAVFAIAPGFQRGELIGEGLVG